MKLNSKKYILMGILIIQNIFYLFVTLINYNSMRGTDYEKYSKLLNYFINNQTEAVGLESGVSYFWYVSLFFNLFKSPLKYNNDSLEYILTFSIQIANFSLFMIGLAGIYFLLKKKLHYSLTEIYYLLIILSVFPPIIGARMILKPEIMVFGLLPWLLLFYFEYFQNKKLLPLFLSIPVISLLMTLKMSISFMLCITMLVIFNKKLFQLQFLSINIISLLTFSYLIYENYLINGNYLWQHIAPPSYESTAEFSYVYSINLKELWNNPYIYSQKNSMIGILLSDTFADYWQRYWFHYDGWGLKINGNTVSKNYPGNLNIIRTSIVLSFTFYLSVIIFLIKEKNKKLFNFGILGFLGLLALVTNALNLLGTKQFFDVTKGDPMKTHLFSFILIFTFLYFLIKIRIHKNLLIFSIFAVSLNLFLIMMLSPVGVYEIINTPSLLSRIYHFGPCQLTLLIDAIFSTDFTQCGGSEMLNSNNIYFLKAENRFSANNFTLIISLLSILFYYLNQRIKK
jgi:hypothetical protein